MSTGCTKRFASWPTYQADRSRFSSGRYSSSGSGGSRCSSRAIALAVRAISCIRPRARAALSRSGWNALSRRMIAYRSEAWTPCARAVSSTWLT